jgi:hypothetical protein
MMYAKIRKVKPFCYIVEVRPIEPGGKAGPIFGSLEHSSKQKAISYAIKMGWTITKSWKAAIETNKPTHIETDRGYITFGK